MPAEFLNNLPKNLPTHLTHKFCAVLPILSYYSIIFVKCEMVFCCFNKKFRNHCKKQQRLN